MKTAAMVALGLGLIAAAAPASAKTAVDDKVLADADKAAERMTQRYYIFAVPAPKKPSEVVAKLQDLGYRNFRDFDVWFRHYEVEATFPTGQEVEIRVDPFTGAILDIDENWF